MLYKDCVICGTKIFRASHSTKSKLRRGVNCLTCSKKCASIYSRVQVVFNNRYLSRKRRYKKYVIEHILSKIEDNMNREEIIKMLKKFKKWEYRIDSGRRDR